MQPPHPRSTYELAKRLTVCPLPYDIYERDLVLQACSVRPEDTYR
jgi:hypothetical protein